MSLAESNLNKFDVEKAIGLIICSRAFRTSPVAAFKVEIGDLPLRINRVKLMVAYWVNLQGHNDAHPAKAILGAYETHFNRFGLIENEKVRNRRSGLYAI